MRYLLCCVLLLTAGFAAANPAGDPLCPDGPVDADGCELRLCTGCGERMEAILSDSQDGYGAFRHIFC